MSDYGLTPQGPNIKRLDKILEDMHSNLSARWGVNTRQNPESFLGHLLMNFADRAAELWEFAEDVYYSQYPSSAEGASLDNAMQFGGSQRETASKSYYPIHCKAKDGTVLAAGSMIASTTNPVTQLTLATDKTISRSAFNKAEVKVVAASPNGVYTVALNGSVFSYVAKTTDYLEILNGLKEVIKDEYFTTEVDAENLLLKIDAVDLRSTNAMILSENLTTETVTSVITFGTTEIGDILVPDGAITEIVQADMRLQSVVNLCGYVAGRLEETDTEARQSYIDKIFRRSTRMLESVRSAILANVAGVTTVAPYENPTHEWDEYGRPPHSIEIVVDGGDPLQIAQQILNEKAGGINTFGDTTVIVQGEYDEDIPISFSRPTKVFAWFKISLVLNKTEVLPANYIDLVRTVAYDYIYGLQAGEDIIPQEFVCRLHNTCPGVAYFDILMFTTLDANEVPGEYTERSREVTARQRAYTTEEMIEVVIYA